MLDNIQEGSQYVIENYFFETATVQNAKALAVPEDEENVESIEYTVDGQETDTVEFDENSREIDVKITIDWVDGTKTVITMLIEYTYTGT